MPQQPLRLVRDYLVRVTYREPNFEEAEPKARSPFTWTWRIAAAGVEEAKNRAIREFDRMQLLSSVGWIREVVDIHVEPAPRSSAPVSVTYL